MAISAAGTVAAAVDTPHGFGVALNRDTVNGRVVWPGQLIDGCKVGGSGDAAINSKGQIALYVFCSNNDRSEIVLATPN